MVVNGKRIGRCWPAVWLLATILAAFAACARNSETSVLPTPAATDSRLATPTASATKPTRTLDPTLCALSTDGPDKHHVLSGLVYDSQNALWQVKPDGERAKILEPLDGIPWMRPKPALSSDGTQVLYEEADDIWLADISTGERRNLTRTPDHFECCPQWGSGQTDTISLYHPYEPVGRGGFPATPVWSPDGQWFIIVAWDKKSDESGTWIMRADGEGEHHVNLGSSWVWSPDGRWLAWTVIPPHDRDGLFEVDTWETHRLHLPLDARLIAWIEPDVGDRP